MCLLLSPSYDSPFLLFHPPAMPAAGNHRGPATATGTQQPPAFHAQHTLVSNVQRAVPACPPWPWPACARPRPRHPEPAVLAARGLALACRTRCLPLATGTINAGKNINLCLFGCPGSVLQRSAPAHFSEIGPNRSKNNALGVLGTCRGVHSSFFTHWPWHFWLLTPYRNRVYVAG
jgi:hypothetical protein